MTAKRSIPGLLSVCKLKFCKKCRVVFLTKQGQPFVKSIFYAEII